MGKDSPVAPLSQGQEAPVARLSQGKDSPVAPLSQWLQLMLAEIASKREEQLRAETEQTRRAAEGAAQRAPAAPSPAAHVARRRPT